jgi:hypothetical protein
MKNVILRVIDICLFWNVFQEIKIVPTLMEILWIKNNNKNIKFAPISESAAQ